MFALLATLPLPSLAASGSGLLFTLQQTTWPGKTILILLFLGSIFSWTVMLNKARMLRLAQRQRDHFLRNFREDRQPLKLYTDIAQPITPAQMRVIGTAMERAVGEAALRLESQMIVLATAVSGAPFLGLLGTVWGVMETFGDVAAAGTANLTAMAPGVSAALITTVTGLLVAIPAMFGYNYLVTTVRAMVVQLDNFAAELASEFEHRFVDHKR